MEVALGHKARWISNDNKSTVRMYEYTRTAERNNINKMEGLSFCMNQFHQDKYHAGSH